MNPTKKALLDAAHAEFVEVGISRSTMASIARRAGVSRQSAYNHLGSVNAIVGDVITNEIARFLTLVDPSQDNEEELIDAIVAVTMSVRDSKLITSILRHDPHVFVEYQFGRLGQSQIMAIDRLEQLVGNRDKATFILMIAQSAAFSRDAVMPQLQSQDAWETALRALVKGLLDVDLLP